MSHQQTVRKWALAADQTTSKIGANTAPIVSIELSVPLLPDPQRHGWTLHAHPLFLDQIERLLTAVERAKQSDPGTWQDKADTKLLAALRTLILDRIPRDPLATDFRQGNTLGREHRHWFRAKFAGNRFRLFFRADSQARVIVYAWVNDRDTLRKAGAGTDPYAFLNVCWPTEIRPTIGLRYWRRRQVRIRKAGSA